MIGYLCGGMISVKKNSRELMNSIMTSGEASEESEFLSALNASLQSFVHKTLKDEQIECIYRIAFHGRCFGGAIYVLSPFSLIRNFRKQNTRGNVFNISQPRSQGPLSTSRKYPGYGWSRVC